MRTRWGRRARAYIQLTHLRNLLLIVIVGILAASVAVLLTMLTRLVFRRLDHIITVATRVVGGDYESQIQISSSDEIGQFEQLFEQFREVFVNLLQEMKVTQEK